MLFGMYGNVSEAISIDLANSLLLLSFAITWSGARVFDGRPVLPMYGSLARKSAKTDIFFNCLGCLG